MNDNPFFSIVTRIRDMSHFFDEMYLSFQNQTFQDFEMWILDHKSTDDIYDKIKKIQTYNKNVHYKKIYNFLDFWDSYNFVNGNVIVYFDADDIASDEYLDKIYKEYERDKDLDFVLNNAINFQNNNKNKVERLNHYYPQEKNHPNNMKLKILGGGILAKGISYKKEFAKKIFKKYPPKNTFADDIEAILIFDIFKGKYKIIHDYLMFYRVHEKSMIQKALKEKKIIVDDEYIAKNFDELWDRVYERFYEIIKPKKVSENKDVYNDIIQHLEHNCFISKNDYDPHLNYEEIRNEKWEKRPLLLEKNKNSLLIISPHLSTGGMPQYLLKYIEHIKDKYEEIKVVEFTNHSYEYIIQKNKIKNIIGEENLITLGDISDWNNDDIYIRKREKLINIIEEYNPNVIYMSESPEGYEYKKIPNNILEYLYDNSRKYKIIESSHNNSISFNEKKYIPDEFLFCSEYHVEKTKHIDIPKNIWEYPIEKKERPNRDNALKFLGLDPNYLHVLNVGLIHPNKNQKYIYDMAEEFKNKNIIFHFIGNTCFLNECDIGKEKLNNKNCILWGERDDVDKFMSCMDLFLFPSKKELNPIVIKEALSWGMDIISSNSYNTSQYKKYNNFKLIEEINVEEYIIKKQLNLDVHKLENIDITNKKNGKFLIVCSFYNNTIDHIKQTFNNILKQTYKNWILIVGDDFSTNNCKDLLKQEIKKINHPNILYYDVKYKRELYLYQNLFNTINYDYYFDLDSDDILHHNILEIYNYYFNKFPNVSSIFCDYEVISENGNLERISTFKSPPDLDFIEDFYKRTKLSYNEIWTYYHSWNMYGTARCFRKNNNNSFLISKNCKTSTDSFFLFSSLYYGDHLTIPRNLYKAINRRDSDSSEMPLEEYNRYNENALYAINKYKENNKKFKAINYYDDIWLETNALSFYSFKEEKDISIITNTNEVQIQKIKELYYDKKIKINDPDTNNLIVIWNKLNKNQKIEILKILNHNNFNFLIYCFLDDFTIDKNEINNYFKKEFDDLLLKVKGHIDEFYFFHYFRHIYIIKGKFDE